MRPLAIISARVGDTHRTSRDLREIAVLRLDPIEGEATDIYAARIRPVRLVERLEADHAAVWLSEAMDEVRSRTRGCTLAAVDAGMTRRLLDDACAEWELLPLDLEAQSLDLGSLAWPLVRTGAATSMSYEALCVACVLDARTRASALDEVSVVGEVYRRLVRRTEPPLDLAGFSADEQKIVSTIIARIADGRRTYGPWRIPDGRNNPQEALAEVMDALNYCAAELVRLSAIGGVQ